MRNQLKCSCDSTFNRVTIDTEAPQKSVMFLKKYEYYGREFGRIFPIVKPQRGLKGIGGHSKVIGEITIQIPINYLNMIIDVVLAIM